MEQYELAPKQIYRDLIYSIAKYEPSSLYIRLRGSMGGGVKVNEELKGKKLEVKDVKKGLLVLVDGRERFLFEEDNRHWPRKFSLAYERKPGKDGIIPHLPTGINPDDPNLPEVAMSFFRSGNSDHLMEIYFPTKIPLKFHSWWFKKSGFKYWQVDRNR